jgi:hypothetical protein
LQLLAALQQLLTENNSPAANKASVLASSHIGGHKHAGTLRIALALHVQGLLLLGTLIVYPQGDWYGRVTARDAERLLRCVQTGKVWREKYRGRTGVQPDTEGKEKKDKKDKEPKSDKKKNPSQESTEADASKRPKQDTDEPPGSLSPPPSA